MTKDRCIVYMLIKEYRTHRDIANRLRNHSNKEIYHMALHSSHTSWNCAESARRILYDTEL